MNMVNLIINILLVIGGLGAFIVYFFQGRRRLQEAAALIVTQIEELKEKVLQINDSTLDNTINQKAFYEIQDIITTNQW